MEALKTSLRRGGKLGALISVLLNCGPGEVVELSEPEPGDAYCVFVIGSVGYFEDGSLSLIGNWEEGRVVGGCVCAPFEEIEAGLHREEMNQLALEECQRYAMMRDFVSDECVEDYESGEWLSAVFRCEPGSDCENIPSSELDCAGE